ncbi:site-specific integrase, partial [Proteus myxofaciens]|uniref:site-specific integrase n=1 Tax=Proteus myxofaciens TaxID=184072 RepID=UPI001428919F
MPQNKLLTKTAIQENEAIFTLIEQFLDNIWLEQGLSANTLSSYRLDLQALGQWLVSNKLDWLSVTT